MGISREPSPESVRWQGTGARLHQLSEVAALLKCSVRQDLASEGSMTNTY